MVKQKINLDNNATTEIDPYVREVVVESLIRDIGNPSSAHFLGKASKARLIKAHESIAEYFKVDPHEIIFTAGGTESANLVLRGLFTAKHQGHIVTSSVEHSSVFETIKHLEHLGFCTASYLNPGALGAVTVDAVRETVRPDTRLIALMAVNNETGVRTDVEAIAAWAEEKRIAFFVDGVAWLGKEIFSIPKGVSAIAFSGHKIHAPKGVGILVLRKGVSLEPLLTGGDQEYGRRAGTENLPVILGLAKAIEILRKELPEAAFRMQKLRDHFEQALREKLGNRMQVNGMGPRICNTSNLAFEGIEGEVLLTTLDLEGIAVSHGSACSSGGLEPSRILLNMGYSMERAASSLRFSFSRNNTVEEVDRCIEVILRRFLGRLK